MKSSPYSVIPFALALLVGCAEQPVGYIFEPSDRDKVSLGLTTVDVLNALYNMGDEAATYLERSSLTDNYLSMLPEGWMKTVELDSATNELYALYVHNFLDQKFNLLRFDRVPLEGTVRTPSMIDHSFVEISTFQNSITNQRYGSVSEYRKLSIAYASQRADPTTLEGWFDIRRTIPYEYTIEIAGQGGQGQTVTLTDYYNVTWLLRLQNFSVNPNDERGRVVIDGFFPITDEAGETQIPHIAGSFNINSAGRGSGEIRLSGSPAVTIRLRGRTHEFQYSLDTIGGD